jgi:hypothetical protein
MQVAKSIQYQSVPIEFLPGPSWMQATGQALTQSATPSQVLVTIEWGMGVLKIMQQSILAKLGLNYFPKGFEQDRSPTAEELH